MAKWKIRPGTRTMEIDGTPVTATAAELNAMAGATATPAEISKLAGVTAGTVTASKAVVVDASSKVDTWDPTVLKIGGTTVGATAAELTRAADVSARVVPVLATGSITEVLHEGKTILLDATATLVTLTLPAATGGGGIYKFMVKTINTSSYVIQKAGSDVFRGSLNVLDNDAAAQGAFAAIAAGDDVLTLNGTTTGGQVGDCVIFEDIVAGVWSVRGNVVVPAGSNPADMFS